MINSESDDHSPKMDGLFIDGVEVKIGDKVKLHPNRQADVFDMILEGMTAIVESFEQDLEDRIYVTVTLEDDPGRDFGVAQQPGHRFFFSPDEVEPLPIVEGAE